MKTKEKQQSGLAQSIGYAGSRRPLIYLGCVLSGVAAVLGIAPYKGTFVGRFPYGETCC